MKLAFLNSRRVSWDDENPKNTFLTLLHQKKEFLKFSKFSHNLLIKNVLNPESLWKNNNNDVDRAFPNFQFLNVRITLLRVVVPLSVVPVVPVVAQLIDD